MAASIKIPDEAKKRVESLAAEQSPKVTLSAMLEHIINEYWQNHRKGAANVPKKKSRK